MSNETITAPGRENLERSPYSIVETRTDVIRAICQLKTTANAQIGLVSISLHYTDTEKNGQSGAVGNKHTRSSSIYLLENIRPLVRKTDLVFLQRDTLHFILPGANVQGAMIVEERLWEALLWRIHNMGEHQMVRPVAMLIGHAAYPESHTNPDELLAAASIVSRRFDEYPEPARQRGTQRLEAGDQIGQEELPQLAKKLGVPYLSLLPRQLPRRVQQVLNAKLAHELRCYPVGRARNTLTVAMLDPQDRRALERLQRETGLRIFPVLAHPEALETALKHLN